MSIRWVQNLTNQEKDEGTYLIEIEHKRLEPGHVRLMRPHVLPRAVPVTADFHRLLVVWGRRSKSRNFGFILGVGDALSPLCHVTTI